MEFQPVELGRAEILRWGEDGNILCAGTPLASAIDAAEALRSEGLDVGVINARFVKPLDRETLSRAFADNKFVVTVEEGMLMGGFGSAVLEAASEMNLDTRNVHRLGIPDVFIEHGNRDDLLADIKIDASGIASTCRVAAMSRESTKSDKRSIA